MQEFETMGVKVESMLFSLLQELCKLHTGNGTKANLALLKHEAQELKGQIPESDRSGLQGGDENSEDMKIVAVIRSVLPGVLGGICSVFQSYAEERRRCQQPTLLSIFADSEQELVARLKGVVLTYFPDRSDTEVQSMIKYILELKVASSHVGPLF